MPSPFSVLKSALGGKRKGPGASKASGTATVPGSTQSPMPATATPYQTAGHPGAPLYPGLIYPPSFTFGQPVAPAAIPAPSASSPATSPNGLIAGGMPLTSPPAFRAVLGVSDFRWIGLKPTLDEPELSVEDGNGVSASWTADTEEQGGIELDIFNAAGGDPASVLANIMKEGEGTPNVIQFSGAEEAYEAQSDGYAWLAARRGALVFVLSIPSAPQASQQLAYLGGLILHRVSTS